MRKLISTLCAAVVMLMAVSCGQQPYEERVAEPLKIKVAVVYEDPVPVSDLLPH